MPDGKYGEVSEWFKELVLKTSDAKAPRVRISASPFFNIYLVLIQFGGKHYMYGEVLKLAEEAPLLRV